MAAGSNGYRARPGEAPAHAGTDFIIARDGRIAATYVFLDKRWSSDVRFQELAHTADEYLASGCGR